MKNTDVVSGQNNLKKKKKSFLMSGWVLSGRIFLGGKNSKLHHILTHKMHNWDSKSLNQIHTQREKMVKWPWNPQWWCQNVDEASGKSRPKQLRSRLKAPNFLMVPSYIKGNYYVLFEYHKCILSPFTWMVSLTKSTIYVRKGSTHL